MLRGLARLGDTYTLNGGAVIDLPEGFFGGVMSPDEQIQWIAQSTLSPDVSQKLEEELGLDVFGDRTTAGPPPGANSGGITTVNQLKAAIESSPSGYILAPKNSPAHIIAAENWLWYSSSLDPLNVAQYRISKSNMVWYFAAGAAVLLLTGIVGGRASS